MVEFGAGGTIVHNDTSNTTANAGAETTPGEGGSAAPNTNGATEGTNPPTVTPPHPRRKRKAKGWFCPVCRQRQYFLRKRVEFVMFNLNIRSLYVPLAHLHDAADKGHF